jgi:hypothetical protein
MDRQFTPLAWYAGLIRSFLEGKVPAARIQDEFFEAWRRDRATAERVKEAWPKPLDADLTARWCAGELTDDDFHREWERLWSDVNFSYAGRGLIDAAFTAIEHWCDNEGGTAPKDSGSESALRRDLAEIEGKLRSGVGLQR